MNTKLNSFQEGNAKIKTSSATNKSGFRGGSDLVKARIAEELKNRITNWPAIVGSQNGKEAA